MNNQKTYVDMLVRMTENGKVMPVAILWNEKQYVIDSITDMRPAASLKGGGCGFRYTVKIQGQERYLFYEDFEKKWFIEGR